MIRQVIASLIVFAALTGTATRSLSDPQATASPPPDWYQASFSQNVYTNQALGFRVTLPQGWTHVDPDALRKADDQKYQRSVDDIVKQTGRADLIRSGVVVVPHVYTLLDTSSSLTAKPGTDVFFTIKAQGPGCTGFPGGPEFYFQENEWFSSPDVNVVSKPAPVKYGGRDFSQLDITFHDSGQPRYSRLMVTCDQQLYVIFALVGNNGPDVDALMQIPKSIQFTGS